MHYVPPTLTTVVAPSTESSERPLPNAAIPLYFLTGIVGLLLGIDTLISTVNTPAWNTYLHLFGFRLALIAAVLGGARILYQTLEGLFEGRVGADLALTIACLAAIVLGEPGVAALVVFIALCGESLEGYIGSRATHAVSTLLAVRPSRARVTRDGQELDLPIEQVLVGDVIVVRPGERIPCDGTVVTGRSAVDESALTGESLPVDKGTGSTIFAGTLNQFGALTATVEKVGAETSFGQIVELVVAATQKKTDLERTADRLARYFLPAVLAIALATLIGWRFTTGSWRAGWLPALSVLVVACPCPLILATPSAVLAALAWLARNGIVIKGSAALERLASIDTVVFDKTGTLTTGKLAIGDIYAFGVLTGDDVLRIAAAAERYSEHPLGRLIVATATERALDIPIPADFTAVPGAGVTASVSRQALQGNNRQQALLLRAGPDDHCQIRVGNLRFFEEQGLNVAGHLAGWLQALDESGQTPMLVAVQETVIGVMGARDTVRPEARETLSALRTESGRKLNFALLTGDRMAPARRVVEAIGPFETVAAELRPDDKARWITDEQQSGRQVLMIGDGINDAPALATAHVGIALGGVGTQIASEAGDIILLGQPLTPLPGLMRLSRELVRVIQQSIYWFAFGLNGIGVLLCAFGWLNPVGAALFHEVASLAVMLNALRLLWFERWSANPLGRAILRCGQCVEFGVDALSPSRATLWVVRYAHVLMRLAFTAGIAAWLLSNLVLVGGNEQALVMRFGKHEAILQPGIYWRWPYPFEKVRRERVDAIRNLQLGYRSTGVSETPDDYSLGPIEWQADHRETGYQPISAEAEMLSGEEVPVEITAEILYRISDLQQYVYGATDVEPILRSMAERALRETIARWKMEDILTARRAELAQTALSLLQSQAATYRLGVDVVGVQLLDVHPPVAIVPNYRDVANALEEREQLLNEAQAEYVREIYSSVGEAGAKVLNLAQPPEMLLDADGNPLPIDWKLDEQQWDTLISKAAESQAPSQEQPQPPLPSTLAGLAGSMLEDARRDQASLFAEARGEAERFERLLKPYRAAPQLSRLHMYWSALERALAQTTLTIVDPAAKGRHQLFLRARNAGTARNSLSGNSSTDALPVVVPTSPESLSQNLPETNLKNSESRETSTQEVLRPRPPATPSPREIPALEH